MKNSLSSESRRRTILSVVLAVIIISFAVALILYDMRVFDISFIKRPRCP